MGIASLSAWLSMVGAKFRASYCPATESEVLLVDRQLTAARESARYAFFIIPLCAAALGFANLAWLPWWRVAFWSALVILVTLLSGMSYEAMLTGSGNPADNVRQRAQTSTWLSLLQTVAWCAMSIAFWAPGHNNINHLLVDLALFSSLAVWTVIGTSHFSTGLVSFPAYLLALLALYPLTGKVEVAVAITPFWLLMTALFYANYNTRERSMLLAMEREKLIEDLVAEKATSDRARERAEAANKTRSAFLANMSYELRTPLNAILGFSEILQSGALGPSAKDQYREYGGYIQSSGRHLLELINGVLDLAKIESGKLVLQETTLDIGNLMRDAIEMQAIAAQSAGLHTGVHVDDDVPLIYGDERALRQVLDVLLSNAIKFTPADGTVACFAERGLDGSIAFGVFDSGVGIARVDQTRLLEGFGEGRADAVMPGKGRGLGLPVACGLIAAHGGQVSIDSEPGTGSRFTITFPSERARTRETSAKAA